MFERVLDRLHWTVVVITAVLVCRTFPSVCLAQGESASQVSPKVFGFDIPSGPLRRGEGRRVQTRDDTGEKVVARVHVQVGDHFIVMLPDGRLVSRTDGEVQPTEAPFLAASMDQIARRLTSTTLRGYRVKKARRYLYIYNTSNNFTEGTSRILQTMFPGMVVYLRSMGLKPREPEIPMVVIMFKTEAEYQRFNRTPKGMSAYYNAVENHVVMYEQSRLTGIKPELAIKQKISMIAHEGVHQILHNVGIQQRLSVWPQWFAEGTAEFFAPTTTDQKMRWKGAGKVNDMRMFELERYLKGRAAETPDGQLIEHSVLAARLSSTGYATSWALTHFLARYYRVQFQKYFREISETPPLQGALGIVKPGIVPGNKELFVKHFGDDFAGMEKRLVAHLKKLPYSDPFAELPHYVATIALRIPTRNSRIANVFHTERQARRWQRETLEKVEKEKRVGAQLTISKHPNRLLAERFAAAWLRKQ